MALRAVHGLSLCSGIGGLDLGLRLALGGRYRTVCYVEREAYAAAILAARMDDGGLDPAPIWDDVRSFDARAWRGCVDLVLAGYPCQPFSLAGRRRGVDDPRHLWTDVLRVFLESEASALVVENVRGHVSCGLREVLSDLASVGVHAEWDLFSAEEEGAPHRRERLFLLAYLDREQLRELQGRGSGTQGTALAPVARDHGSLGKLGDPNGLGRELGRVGGASRGGEPEDPGRWPPEPGVGRVAHGCPRRVDRIRALGNAVVPRVAARAWRELAARALADRTR